MRTEQLIRGVNEWKCVILSHPPPLHCHSELFDHRKSSIMHFHLQYIRMGRQSSCFLFVFCKAPLKHRGNLKCPGYMVVICPIDWSVTESHEGRSYLIWVGHQKEKEERGTTTQESCHAADIMRNFFAEAMMDSPPWKYINNYHELIQPHISVTACTDPLALKLWSSEALRWVDRWWLTHWQNRITNNTES